MRRLVCAVVLAAVAVLTAAAPATAEGELQVSTNGVTWLPELPAPIFDPAFRWVPGDVETATFHVRNATREPGVLELRMLSSQVTDLIDSGDLEIAVRFGNRPWQATTVAGERILLAGVHLGPRRSGAVRVRVSFDPASTNETQDRVFDLRFRVTLSQNSAAVSPPGNVGGGDGQGGNGPGGLLPGTGADLTPTTIVLGLLLLAAGGGLALLGARRNDPKERQS